MERNITKLVTNLYYQMLTIKTNFSISSFSSIYRTYLTLNKDKDIN